MPEWLTQDGKLVPGHAELQEQLRAEQETNLLLEETIADLELALEDRAYTRLSGDVRDEFSAAGRRTMASLCRTMVVANPLIKRGVLLRISYVWGSGVQVEARAGEDDTQDVNGVVARFWDDNAKSLTGGQSQEELERALATDGEVFLAAFTSPLTGRIQIRSTSADEITEVITNPEDRDEPWFYVREYVEQVIEAGYDPGTTRTRGQTVKVVHPALSYRPSQRIKVLNGKPVMWDAPILHIPVNRLDGWKRGVPDVYAALAWARAYKDFLTDWALLTKSLAKFAWRATGDSKSKASRAATVARANAAVTPGVLPGPETVGQMAAMGPGNTLEAIPKSGAHIDAESGKPLAAMVAAGLGIPVTMLLADPGVTGARATAETLDKPTILEMGMRRMLWEAKLGELLDYVIDQAVIAPRGPLKGTVTIDDWGRRIVTLAGDTERTVEWTWPPLADLDPIKFVEAIVAAEGTGLLPPVPVVRLLLQALGVKDVDEIIEEFTDADGTWSITPDTAGDVAVQAARRGESDPSEFPEDAAAADAG